MDFEQLPISEYNRSYIRKILPQLNYYFSIYIRALSSFPEHKREDTLVVDFGGGHGFLSLFLKYLGYRVIYCDLNPLSVKTVTLIKEELSEGPDFVVEGGAADLKQFCRENDLKPDFLIATDVIEHVYDLTVFFGELQELDPSLEMVFTTGSNPVNRYKSLRLREYMKQAEREYFPQRREFIKRRYPDLPAEEADNLARLCRGKTYTDIQTAVDLYRLNGVLPEELADRFNTCDPSNGNWTERILPFDEYMLSAAENGFQTSFLPGFYNEFRRNKLPAIICRYLNRFIRKFPKIRWKIAPFIFIRLSPLNE